MPATYPLVSIVVNNYNYARFLPAAIDSVLNQTYASIELIVVDDGSTDESREILTRQYDTRFRVILQENQGQSQAVTAGFLASHGDILMFLDADDMLMPHAVETVVNLWEPGLSKVHFKLRAIDAESQRLPIMVPRGDLQEGDIQELLIRYGEYVSSPTSGNAFSRLALNRVMPIPVEWPSKKAADKYLLHSTPFFGEVRACQEPLGYYRIHGNNRSQISSSDEKTIRTISAYLNEQIAVRHLIATTAARKGLVAAPGCVIESYTFRKNRLALKKLGTVLEQLSDESLEKMTRRFIVSAWRYPGLDFLMRCVISAWALILCYSTQALARPVLLAGLAPMSRPSWLKRSILFVSNRAPVLSLRPRMSTES